MNRFIKNKKGMSIVELIIAVTLLAVCTVPLLTGFANVARVNKMTKNQIEINAVAKLVQQQLIEHIKKGDIVEYYDASGAVKNDKYIKDSGGYQEVVNGVVRENNSAINNNFKYDAKCKSFTDNLCEYDVILYKKNGASYDPVQKFMVTAYVD